MHILKLRPIGNVAKSLMDSHSSVSEESSFPLKADVAES
jgi:hypothetical protein